MQANAASLAERVRSRTILVAATIAGVIVLLPLVVMADRTPELFSPDTVNRLDLWIILMARIAGPFGVPVGLLAAWFVYANEKYRQAVRWLLLPVVWGAVCLIADLVAAHYGPWYLP